MPIVVAGLVLVGALCLLDLVLTFGVVRRLREHTEHLDRLLAAGAERPAGGLAVGTSVGSFVASTVDGEVVDEQSLTGSVLLGFFAPGCQPCAEQLPKFVELAEGSSQVRTLAVVVTDGTESRDEVERLRAVARVIVESPAGPVTRAFEVSAFPTLYQVTDGVVTATGLTTAVLSVPVLS